MHRTLDATISGSNPDRATFWEILFIMAKKSEICPTCNIETLPIDKAIALDTEYGTVPFKQWRYECTGCGWTWANEAQRQYNARLYNKILKTISNRGWQ
jgi:hypothetical protein